MWGFEDLHLSAPLATALEAMGWTPDDAVAREVVPTAARGHNLVAAAPPAAIYAAPAVAGMCGALSQAPAGGTRGAILCPVGTLDEWAGVAEPLAAAAGLRLHVARGLARASRLLRAGPPDLLLATPELALTLLSRAALKLEGMRGLFLAWPDLYESEETFAPLMGDLPKDAQRIIYTAEAGRVAGLVERYARKALTVGVAAEDADRGGHGAGHGAGGEGPPAHGAIPPVRTVTVPWERREAVLPDLLEVLDPATCVVWTRHPGNVAAIGRLFPTTDTVRAVTGDAPAAELVIAYDVPSRERLQQLARAGQVLVLVPPHAVSYVQALAPTRAVRLPGIVESVTTAAATRRAAVARALESRPLDRALLTLAPLFERHDPAAVAAALYELWSDSAAGAVPAAAATAAAAPPDIPATAKVWVGVGKKDGATPNDLVAVLTKEVRVDRTKIGKVDVREMYSLVELPAQEVERVATELNGTMIRRRRVTARVDRGVARVRRG